MIVRARVAQCDTATLINAARDAERWERDGALGFENVLSDLVADVMAKIETDYSRALWLREVTAEVWRELAYRNTAGLRSNFMIDAAP